MHAVEELAEEELEVDDIEEDSEDVVRDLVGSSVGLCFGVGSSSGFSGPKTAGGVSGGGGGRGERGAPPIGRAGIGPGQLCRSGFGIQGHEIFGRPGTENTVFHDGGWESPNIMVPP